MKAKDLRERTDRGPRASSRRSLEQGPVLAPVQELHRTSSNDTRLHPARRGATSRAIEADPRASGSSSRSSRKAGGRVVSREARRKPQSRRAERRATRGSPPQADRPRDERQDGQDRHRRGRRASSATPSTRSTFASAKRYKAHDEKNEYKVGDRVEIQEHRPISRDKRWKVVRLIDAVAVRGVRRHDPDADASSTSPTTPAPSASSASRCSAARAAATPASATSSSSPSRRRCPAPR